MNESLPHFATLRYLHSDAESVIPTDLLSLSQWITWKAGPKKEGGKFDKHPKGKDGTGSAWQKSGQWSSFATARAFAKQHGLSGLGVVLPAQFSDGSYLVVMDYDGVDLENTENNPRLEEIRAAHEKFNSPYIERSPSGKGLRIFLRSSVLIPQISVFNPLGGKDELFCASGKWATFTGDYEGGEGIPDVTEELLMMVSQWQARLSISKRSPETSVATRNRTMSNMVGNSLSHLAYKKWTGWPAAKLKDEDGRESTMLAYAGHLRALGHTQDEIEKMCLDANVNHYEDRLDDDVVLDRARRYQDQEESVHFEDQLDKSVISFKITGKNRRPLQVTENLHAVLTHHTTQVRYNQVSKRCEVIIPGLTCILDEVDNTALTSVTDLAIKAGLSSARIPEMVEALASQSPYCPVQTYIESVPWDGTSRFSQFTNQIQCDNPKFAAMLFKKWLIQAVGAVYEPEGIVNAGVIVLTGLQGVGKTRLFADLTSGVSHVFLEGQTLNPTDKDSVMSAVSHWVVELGELDSTFKKSDVSVLKAFITRRQDKLRRPYARRDSVFPRRTVFAGTVNDYQFLHDNTGNRRFWPIDVHSIVRDTTIDFQQLWAEVKTWYDQGDRWYLDDGERWALEQYSEKFMALDPEVEILLSRYQFAGCTNWEEKTMVEICRVLCIGNPTKAQTMRLANAIRKFNGGKRPRESNGLKYHHVPVLPETDLRGLNLSELGR